MLLSVRRLTCDKHKSACTLFGKSILIVFVKICVEIMIVRIQILKNTSIVSPWALFIVEGTSSLGEIFQDIKSGEYVNLFVLSRGTLKLLL